ncbi:hypothetical protein [Neobacillus sp. NPDC093127]|uniref:hypothetical protein n=1 Tax=Neobacillus sp. NPDC093127 TaxID=3364296 RepID=UPI0037F9D515
MIEDYNFVPNGRSGEFEDNSKVYYTKEDQKILDERDRILGPLPFLSGFCFFLAIGSAIVFFVLSYLKVSDGWEKVSNSWEERRQKANKIKQEAFQKAQQEKISQINQNFIEKVENIIKKHEISGTAMSSQEALARRTEMNNTINSFSTKINAEYMIKKHMQIHNPKWK